MSWVPEKKRNFFFREYVVSVCASRNGTVYPLRVHKNNHGLRHFHIISKVIHHIKHVNLWSCCWLC